MPSDRPAQRLALDAWERDQAHDEALQLQDLLEGLRESCLIEEASRQRARRFHAGA